MLTYEEFIKEFTKETFKDKFTAAKEVYKLGYITEEEAEELANHGRTQRNECTTLYMFNTLYGYAIACYEIEEDKREQQLFRLLYDNKSGTVKEDF